jgi:hypothetical protein
MVLFFVFYFVLFSVLLLKIINYIFILAGAVSSAACMWGARQSIGRRCTRRASGDDGTPVLLEPPPKAYA